MFPNKIKMPARKKRGRGQPKLAKEEMTKGRDRMAVNVKDVSSISLTDEINLSGDCGVQGGDGSGGDDGDGGVVEAGVAPVAMSPKSVQLSIPLTPPTTVDPDVWNRIFLRQFDIDETGEYEDDEDELKSIREEFGLVRPSDRSSPDPPSLAFDFKFNPYILKEMGLQLALENPDLYRKHLPYECDSGDDEIGPGAGKERQNISQNTVTTGKNKNGSDKIGENDRIDDYEIEVTPGPSRACRKPPYDAPLTLPVHPPPSPSSISNDVEDMDVNANEKDLKVNNVSTKKAKNKRKRSGSKRKRKGKSKVPKTVVPAKITTEAERWNSFLNKEVSVVVERANSEKPVRNQPGCEDVNTGRSSQKRKSLSPAVKQRPQKRRPVADEGEGVVVTMGSVTLSRLGHFLLPKEPNEPRPPVVSTEEDVLVPPSPPRDTTPPSPPPQGRTSPEKKIEFVTIIEKKNNGIEKNEELTITHNEVNDDLVKENKNTPDEAEVPSTSPPSLPSPPPPPPPPPEESPEDKDNSTTVTAATASTDVGEEAASGECEDQGSEDNRDSIKTNPGSTPDQFLSDFEATPEHPPPSQSPPPQSHSPPPSTEEPSPPPPLEVNSDAHQFTEKSTEEDAVHKGADPGAGATDVVKESLPDAVARAPSTSSTSSSSDDEDDASNDTGSETSRATSRIIITNSPQRPTPSPPPPPPASIQSKAMTTIENPDAAESDTASVSSYDSGDTTVIPRVNVKKEIVESGYQSQGTLDSEAEATGVHGLDHAHDAPPSSPPSSENSSVASPPPVSPSSSEDTKPEVPLPGDVEENDQLDLDTCSRAAFYGCHYCDKIFPCYRDDLLRTHIITKHNWELELNENHLRMTKYEYRDILQCQKCSTLIKRNHMEAHHRQCDPRVLKETLFDKPTVPEDGRFFERYRCEKSLCSSLERFDARYQLRLHLHTAHSDIELHRKAIIFPDFRCATCLKMFESSDDLLKHCLLPCQDKPSAETILEVAKRAQDCELCGVRHVRIAEATNCFQRRSMLRCVLCFDILKQKKSMTQHLKTYHAKSDQKNSGLDYLLIDCPFCNFPRDRYPAVFTHINRAHFYSVLPNQDYDDEDDEAVIEIPRPQRRASADTPGSAWIYPEVQEIPSFTIKMKTNEPLIQNQKNGLPPLVQLQPQTSTSPVPMPVPRPQLTRGLSRPGSASPQPQHMRPLPPLLRGGLIPPNQRVVRASTYRGQASFHRHPVPPGNSELRRPTSLPFRMPFPPNGSRRPLSLSTVSPQRSSSPSSHSATASTSTSSPQGNLSISPVTPKIVSVKSMASGGGNRPQNNNS